MNSRFFTSNCSEKCLLIIIVLMASAVRLPSLFQELPPYLFCDENIFYGEAKRLLHSNTYLLNEFKAGALNIYIPLFFIKIIDYFKYFKLNDENIIILGRLVLVCIINPLSIIFIYKSSIAIFKNKIIGLISAISFFLCGMVYGVSRLWYPDHFLIFFASGFLYYLSITIWSDRNYKNIIYLAIFTASAISVKYTSLLLAIPIFTSIVLDRKIINNKIYFLNNILLFLVTFLAFLGIVNWSVYINFDKFISDFQFNIVNYQPSLEFNWVGVKYYFSTVYFLSFSLLGFFIILYGYIYSFNFNRKFFIISLISPLFIIIYLGASYNIQVHRNMMVCMPFILITFSAGFYAALELMKNHGSKYKFLIASILIIVTGYQASQIISQFINDLKIDSRKVAYFYISKNIPLKSTVGVNEVCSGQSPAEQNSNTIIFDPLMSQKLDYYVINSYWMSPFDPAFKSLGLLTSFTPKYLHFYVFNSAKLFGSQNENINDLVPNNYQIIENIKFSGPEIIILKKVNP